MPEAKRFELHPLCTLFPEPTADEYAELRESIRTLGQLEPITLYEGKILDGRWRYTACLELQLAPRCREYQGNDPLRFVIAENAKRRHLSVGQRAVVAARMMTLTRGGDRRSDQSANLHFEISAEVAAQHMDVSERTVKYAKAVLDSGDAALLAQVERDEIAVSQAANHARAIVRTREGGTAPTPGRKGPHYTVDQWKALSPAERQAVRATVGPGKFNRQTGEEIGWAWWSVNAITGCKHACRIYCYARHLAEGGKGRAPLYPTKFAPTLWPEAVTAVRNMPVPEDPNPAAHNVFVCSMSDMFGEWIPTPWIEWILEECAAHPDWNFLLLTKFPRRLLDFTFADNCWVGTTVDCQARVKAAEEVFARVKAKTKFLSAEPQLTPLTFTRLKLFQWLIIGGASATDQTPAWRPPYDWVARLTLDAQEAGLSIYHKTNLGLGDARLIEFPWQARTPIELPEVFRYLKHMGDRERR